MESTKVGIAVPTLGTRPEFLKHCLLSIRKAGPAVIHLVIPTDVQLHHEITSDLYDKIIPDPGIGLAAAIHAGLQSFSRSVEFINWLGDDDLLKPDSLISTAQILEKNSEIVLVYGACDYIDAENETIFTNHSGRYARPLMYIGPQLIPQPGMLFRRQAYEKIGGLNFCYKWAFDLDLLMRLSKIGQFRFINSTLACFRWHDGSLSVGGRDGSVREASFIRVQNWPRVLRPLAQIWEIPMRYAIKYAGSRVSNRTS